MRIKNIEFWASLVAIALLTTVYLLVILIEGSIPAAGEFFGHSLGVLGFLLMLMTETLYSLRKRSKTAKWGRMSHWLSFHIFTGIVGPYMVLLHTSWKFNGIAGILLLLTAIVVFSGFIGRYIYTAVPRTVDGIEIEAEEIKKSILLTNAQIKGWLNMQPNEAKLFESEISESLKTPEKKSLLIFGRSIEKFKNKRKWRKLYADDAKVNTELAKELEKLVQKRKRLGRQVASLAMTRRMLSVWHSVHIPIGMALFTVSIFHIGGAIYYSTLLQ